MDGIENGGMNEFLLYFPRLLEKVERATILWRTHGFDGMKAEDWRELEALVKEAKGLQARWICVQCGGLLQKRVIPPVTASKGGYQYYDYYKCPHCNVNFARNKEFTI